MSEEAHKGSLEVIQCEDFNTHHSYSQFSQWLAGIFMQVSLSMPNLTGFQNRSLHLSPFKVNFLAKQVVTKRLIFTTTKIISRSQLNIP